MPPPLLLHLRVYSDTESVKKIIAWSPTYQRKYVCSLFIKNGLNQEWIEEVAILDKPVHPYTTFVVFFVKISETSKAVVTLRHIISTWSTSDVWLTPLRVEYICDQQFQGLPFMDLALSHFSFGTILDGTKYIRCTNQLSQFKDAFKKSMASFSFNSGVLNVYFLTTDPIERLYYITFSWDRDFEKRIIVCRDREYGDTRLYFQLHYLPKIFQAESFRRGNHIINSVNPQEYLRGDNYFRWLRKTIFTGCKKGVLGNCTTMELVIGNGIPELMINELLMNMKRFGMEISYCCVQELPPSPGYKWDDLFALCERFFDVYWALKCLHSRGYYVIETVEREPEFVRLISKYMHENRGRKKLRKALDELAGLVESERYISVLKAFENYLSFDHKIPMINYEGLKYTRTVIITPLRVICDPNMPVMSNRVLREYESEYCMRVSYRDENMRQLQASNIDFYDDIVYDHISKPMRFADRVYHFLACSNSQLRSHGVWFYATDNGGITADLIRSEMGDLSQIQNVASLISRMGQCFSTTKRAYTDIDPEWLEIVPDVKRNGYTFSDGAGMISTELCDVVAKHLGCRTHSLYQIRFGGCKGTIAVNPNLCGKKLVIRESMKKFDCYHTDLEICKEATACRLYLNHQSIMLLEQLGVPREIFLSIQEKALFDLLDMLLYEKKAAAMLGHRTVPNIKFQLLVDQGVSLITDPFFRKVLLLLLYKTIDLIRSKGRIELPLEYARNLMGTMDVTNTLEYGEVFVQYSNDLNNKGEDTTVLTGDVIITKFPAVHRGDMRRFIARDVPALHHMVDCIVFPSKGHRPHPDEMAGSDLDGDEYFVTWLPEFLATFQKENQQPMDYSSEKKTIYRPIEINDMCRYITDYVKNDNLGRISNALKVLADTEKNGFFSEKCVKLAHKHSMAVDFPKTEIPVSLDQEEMVVKYPDFMGKQGQNWVYNSKRVLGDMYRVGSNLTDIIEDSYHNDKGYVARMKMPEIAVPQKMHEQADDAYKNYVNGLREIMHSYGIASEEELLSGKVININKRLREDDLYSTVSIVQTMVSQFREYFRKLFFKELDIDKEPQKLVINEMMRVKAVVWYNKVYSQSKPEFLSFAWIVADIIGDVAHTNKATLSSSTDRVTKSICSVYEEVALRHRVREADMPNSKELQIVGQEYPGVVALWMFLCLWCQKQRLEYSYVRNKMDTFLKLRNVIIPTLNPALYDRFGLMMSYVTIDNMEAATLGGASLGDVMLSFFRSCGSQDFFVTEKDFGASMKARHFHSRSLKAYFHLAVNNDCRDLISSESRDDNQIAENKINVIVPSAIWAQIRQNLGTIKSQLMMCFKGLRTVSIERNSRGKKPSGAVFAVGYFEDIIALEYMLNTWFSSFTVQSSYLEDFKRIQENR